MTKYARKILELVENSHSHMTADQVFLLLRETFPTVVLATVYNNLNKLCEEGLIRRVSVEGMPDRFDRVERHDHLICRGCGKPVSYTHLDVYKRQGSVLVIANSALLLHWQKRGGKKARTATGENNEA